MAQNTPAIPPQSPLVVQAAPAFGPLVQTTFDSRQAWLPLPAGGSGSCALQLPVESSGLLQKPPVPQSPFVLHGLSMFVPLTHSPPPPPTPLQTPAPPQSELTAQAKPGRVPPVQVPGPLCESPGDVLWSCVKRTLTLGSPAAPQPTKPPPELPGPNSPALATPCGQAHARFGIVTGEKLTCAAGTATGTMPAASIPPILSCWEPISGPMFSVPTRSTLVSTAPLLCWQEPPLPHGLMQLPPVPQSVFTAHLIPGLGLPALQIKVAGSGFVVLGADGQAAPEVVPPRHAPRPRQTLPSLVATLFLSPHSSVHTPRLPDGPQSVLVAQGLVGKAPPTQVFLNVQSTPLFIPPWHLAPVNWNVTVVSVVQFWAQPSPPNARHSPPGQLLLLVQGFPEFEPPEHVPPSSHCSPASTT